MGKFLVVNNGILYKTKQHVHSVIRVIQCKWSFILQLHIRINITCLCIAQQYRSNSLPRKWLWFHFRWVAKLLEHKMNARTTTVCDLTKALEKRCLWYTQKTIEQVWNEAHKGHIYIYRLYDEWNVFFVLVVKFKITYSVSVLVLDFMGTVN